MSVHRLYDFHKYNIVKHKQNIYQRANCAANGNTHTYTP